MELWVEFTAEHSSGKCENQAECENVGSVPRPGERGGMEERRRESLAAQLVQSICRFLPAEPLCCHGVCRLWCMKLPGL